MGTAIAESSCWIRRKHHLTAACAFAGLGLGAVTTFALDANRNPAATTPALTPADAQKRFVVPKGFEMRLYAAEPDVMNPVAMSWDERGRLWVLELFQYPDKAKPGARGKDRIKILDDVDNDGRADKVTVFADGLDMATGMLVGHGGVYVGQAPDLLFLQDTDGDDRADRRTVLLTGFAFDDTHETLNGFTWGPDGWMYFTHGVFNYSKVRKPEEPESEGNPFDAVVARYHPDRKLLEVFADGTSNPWGVDFDRGGNAFLSACVIDHMFHVSPGGVYVRQAGTPRWPYAYDLLPSIVDHRHFRAAYAGVQILPGDQFPAAYRGNIVMGNIHGNAVNRDRLTGNGASFRATAEPDLIATDDGWFRPVSEQIGPDGALWIADWYDRYPCYQNAKADPAGVDRTRGRIWRLVYVGDKPGAPRPSLRSGRPDLKRLPGADLVALLSHDNVWQRRVAQRVLGERRDGKTTPALTALARAGRTLEARLAGLLALHAGGALDDNLLDALAGDTEPDIRVWVARLSGERNDEDAEGARAIRALPRLARLAADEKPAVRAAVAVAARRMANRDVDPVLTSLAAQVADDHLLGFLIWRAIEPRVVKDLSPYAQFLQRSGSPAQPYAGRLLRYVVRRLYDSRDPVKIGSAIALVDSLADRDAALVEAGLRGIIEAAEGTPGDASLLALLRKLAKRPEDAIGKPALRLAARMGDRKAQAAMLAMVRGSDPRATLADRLAAIDAAGQAAGAEAALAVALGDRKHPDIGVAALRALGKLGTRGAARMIVGQLRALSGGARATAIEALAARPAWAGDLLAAIDRKIVAPSDVPATAQRALRQIKDEKLAARIDRTLGKLRVTSDDRRTLIDEKLRMVMNGPVDFADGRAQAEKICLLCHKFFGQGADVAPDLSGVGRSTLTALLTNVIDPNQIIGAGYEQVTVTTKDGRLISGRLLKRTPRMVTLVGLNLTESVPASQIASLDVSDVSVMPEGLEALPDENFRNLVWYIFAPPHDPANRIRIESRDKKLVVLTRTPGKDPGWAPLLEYVVDPGSRPYIHPLHDPSGALTLTDDRPADHVWQHGVFTGLHKVNGLEYWTEKEGRQHFVKVTDIRQEPDKVGWRSISQWLTTAGDVALEESQDVTVHAPAGNDGYEIDFDWTLHGGTEAVKIGRYDYGGLAIRMPFHPQHSHLNANGAVGKTTSEERARWTTTERAFGNTIWGVAIFDHPGNARHPARWRVDNQGLINPSPSLQGDWGFEPGAHQTFRYRLVVYRGAADAVKLDRAFARYAATVAGDRRERCDIGRCGDPTSTPPVSGNAQSVDR